MKARAAANEQITEIISKRLTGYAPAMRQGIAAIGAHLPITLLRRNALVDVVTVPAELS